MMAAPAAGSACADFLRAHDRDAWLAALLAPERERERLFAIWNVAADALRLPWVASEPAMAMIRLQWWREALAAGAGHPALALIGPRERAALPPLLDAAERLHGGPFAAAEEVLCWGREAFLPLMKALAGEAATGPRHAALAAAFGAAFVLRRAPLARRCGLPLLDRALMEGQGGLPAAARRQLAMARGLPYDPALLAFATCRAWLACAEAGRPCSPLRRQARLGLAFVLRCIC